MASFEWPISSSGGGSGTLAIGSSISGATPGYLLYVDGSGNLANEVAITAAQGGTGANLSASTGILHVASGVFSASAVNLASSDITGTLGLTHGGTGQTSANAALNALLPDQSSANTKFLQSNGTNTSWQSIVASVAIGSAITSSTPGSVLFVDSSSQLAQDNAKFFWDDTNFRLGIGNAAPSVSLHVTGSARVTSLNTSGGVVLNDTSGNLTSAKITTTNIASNANIAVSKLETFATGQILAGVAGTPAVVTLSGDAAIDSLGQLTIANDAITNVKVSSSAAIAYSKLASMSTGQVLLGNAGTPTATTLSGDVTVNATGVTAIGSGKVTNTMLAGSIDLTTKVTGVLPIANGGTNNGSLAVTAGGVVYADGSKLVNTGVGTSGQYLKSNAGSAPAFASFTAPTIQKFTSSSGTYTTPAGVLYIRVRMVGGGGGGGGSATVAGANGGTGGTGGNTTFGSSLLVANGGVGGGANSNGGGNGGTASLGTGPIGTAIQGGKGAGGQNTNLSGVFAGGNGAPSPLGGAGGSNGAAITNSGSGGGGGESPSSGFPGSGGGAGGWVDAIITSPSATYSYAVGAAGTAGALGSSGVAGGAGGSGYIEVTEYYQ